MDFTAILNAITIAAKFAELALQVGGNALPFILKIKAWSAPGANVTQADVDELNAMGQPYIDALNDTSGDDPAEVFQGGE